MKKLLVAGLAAGSLALNAPVVAHASGLTYQGGCGFETLNDTTPGGQLGGQEQWTGGIHAAVVATVPPGGTISIDCVLKINGVSEGVVLSAPPRRAATSAAGSVSFSAADTAVVELCDDVTIDGVPQPEDCKVSTSTPLVPRVVVEVLDTVIDLLNDEVISDGDDRICPTLASAAPGAGPIIINGEGDVWIGSSADSDKFWDCPPYDPPAV